MGLIVAPSCNDCHGVHDIKRGVDRESPINHANVAKTCGKCHVGIEETYDKSVHGQLLAKGDKRGPVCTDCHTAHEVETPKNGHFKMASDQRCGKCHQDRLSITATPTTARPWPSASRTSPPMSPPATTATAITTCCRPQTRPRGSPRPTSWPPASNVIPARTIGFTEYKPHANPLDGKNYPLLHAVFLGMTGLLIGVFAFFGVHTLVWLVRAFYLYLHDSKKFREAKVKTQTDDEWFTRFLPFERFLHFLVVTSFLLLVITGMPLKFYYTDWAKVLFHVIGGADTARALHRLGAIVTFLYFGLHVASLVGRSWRGRARTPRPADRQAEPETALAGAVRAGLDDAHLAGLARFRGAQQVVLRQGPEAAVRPLDLLGEVRLLRRVLGRRHHRRLRPDHVVPARSSPASCPAGSSTSP